jgi:hypothetical protein
MLACCGDYQRFEGEARGIPYLAKNERDMGHPAVVAGIVLRASWVNGKEGGLWRRIEEPAIAHLSERRHLMRLAR